MRTSFQFTSAVGQPLAAIDVKENGRLVQGVGPVRSSLSFRCRRFVEAIDQRIGGVFFNAVRGQAHRDMAANPAGCALDQVAGSCGHKRGALSECRCQMLDRMRDPSKRKAYEDRVIAQILAIIKSQKGSHFRMRLAIFGSGDLLGEEILLFRLMHRLQNMQGTIDLFFIDHCYRGAIQNPKQPNTLQNSVGGKRAIAQFLSEIALCQPRGIMVQGTFFGDAEEYIRVAGSNQNLRHDLLIGADIENGNQVMGKISCNARARNLPPIVLVKLPKQGPAICSLGASGNLERCHRVGRTVNFVARQPLR